MPGAIILMVSSHISGNGYDKEEITYGSTASKFSTMREWIFGKAFTKGFESSVTSDCISSSLRLLESFMLIEMSRTSLASNFGSVEQDRSPIWTRYRDSHYRDRDLTSVIPGSSTGTIQVETC
jgi:hypothetical protein